MMVNLGGFPDRVHAIQLPKVFTDVDGEDGVVMTARLPNGAAGMITCTRAAPAPSEIQSVTVTGSSGRLKFVPNGSEMVFETFEDTTQVPLPAAQRGVRAMLSEFRNAVLEDRQPLMSGPEGTRDLAVVIAAYESARTGETVAVSPPYPA